MIQQDHHSPQEEEKDEDELCNVIADRLYCQLMTSGGGGGGGSGNTGADRSISNRKL